jgi:hypothetical protein
MPPCFGPVEQPGHCPILRPWSSRGGVPPASSNRASRRGWIGHRSGPLWVFTQNGHDWTDRFPAIVDAASRIQASSFLIDGEVVIVRDDGTPDIRALRSKRRGHEATRSRYIRASRARPGAACGRSCLRCWRAMRIMSTP